MMRLKTRLEISGARLRLVVRGAVQGVGFRPFVHHLATALGLAGWVNNSAAGVVMEVEGMPAELELFLVRLETDKPPRSFIQSCEATWLDVVGYEGFEISESDESGVKSTLIMPDTATCPECVREIFDPADRRHRYPFTNCTNCGPRFSIIAALPYDRPNTSMRGFKMCATCRAEYDDPGNRRFHAQPNACHDCGPQLSLWPGDVIATPGNPPRNLAHGNDALLAAAHLIRCGQIVAVKGIGGFHLFADARNEAAIHRLRERKHREEKPFALMFPTLASVKAACEVSALEERLLCSPEAPIVLLRRLIVPPHPRNKISLIASAEIAYSRIAPSVAPNNPYLGVMLPSNPLHHLLLAELGFPIIATSGNVSDEPICTDEFEALDRLRGIADAFLVHNRPIVRHMDDSIVRVMAGRELVLRRARGYAPLPVSSNRQPSILNHHSILAVGAQLKNAVALAVGEQVFTSQHIGDLETEPANQALRRVAGELPQLYEASPQIIATDRHPDYLSTQFARELADRRGNPQRSATGAEPRVRPRLVTVQHHIAHVLSCLAENEVELPALGVAWDGTGLGLDGTIWGGEFFRVTDDGVDRLAHWRPFRLPGGDKAVKEPRRAALGLLHALLGDDVFSRKDIKAVAAFDAAELATLKPMLTRGLNAPWCGSVGRLFDGVSSLVGLRQQMRFEGQAAMELEFATEGIATDATYQLLLADGKSLRQLDWARMIAAILQDSADGVAMGEIAAKFHNTLAEAIVAVARQVACPRVALSGGCFQNRYLTERTVARLREEGFQPYWHQRVPPNDGGIALGQIVAARRGMAAQSVGNAVPMHTVAVPALA